MSIPATVKSFGLLCTQVSNEPSLTIKVEIIQGFVSRFSGDLLTLVKLLLPKYANRVYNAKEKQLLRALSVLLGKEEETLKAEWNRNGCVAETAEKYFKPTTAVDASGWCSMDLQTFDKYLDRMAAASTETSRIDVLRDFFTVACSRTVYLFFRELKQDMRLGAGLRIVLSGVHPNAYSIFQHTASLEQVVEQIEKGKAMAKEGGTAPAGATGRAGGGGGVSARIQLGVPLAPMLAAPSKSVDYVLSKCPNGAFSEVKYDGERIQIHKNKDHLQFFARSLKPMQPSKYAGLESYLKEAIQAETCILDGEILMVDIKTSIPLPFGTLGSHRRNQFQTACPCVFLFDILYKDGQALLQIPLEERREKMKQSVKFIRNRVMFSELCLIKGDIMQRRVTLQKHLNRAIAEGLEGLVIKDIKGRYEPRARHWVKLKKDYLEGLADSADLLVLGAWYGSGSKGGQLSTFLMGCVDTSIPVSDPGRFKTVCKVGNGLSDTSISILSKKYMETMRPMKPGVAPWLHCANLHTPDMVLKDVNTADVMEVIGAEFSITKHHTSGVSIRFPRILRIRQDKTVDTATSCQELLQLFQSSKEKASSAGVSDSLELVDSYAVLDDPEASNPPVTADPTEGPSTSTTTTTTTTKTTAPTRDFPPLDPFSYVQCGDITDPEVPPSANVVLAHSVAQGGQWSTRGVMGHMARKFGPEAQKAYDQSIADRQVGDVIVTEVGPASREGRVYVASLIAQLPSAPKQIPAMDNKALEKCLRHCIDFCERQSASLHFVMPLPGTQMDWSVVEPAVKRYAASKTVPVVIYGPDPHAKEKTVGEKRPRSESAPRASSPPPSTTTAPSTAPTDFFTAPRGESLFSSLRAQIVMPYNGTSVETAELITGRGGEVVSVSPQFNAPIKCDVVVVDGGGPSSSASFSSPTPVVCKEWVEDCVRFDTVMDPRTYHPSHRAVLRGCTVCLPPQEPLREEWERTAVLLGATVTATPTKNTLVLSSDPLHRLEADREALVHPRWLLDCAIAQKALSTKQYGRSTMMTSDEKEEEGEGSDCSTELFFGEGEEEKEAQ